MSKNTVSKRFALLFLLGALFLGACNPKYNWREVQGKDAPFVVLLPDKPVTVTRNVNLGGASVPMTMTAAEVDGVSFAVGYVLLTDANRAPEALNAMKSALLRNINGTIKATPSANPQAPATSEANGNNDIEAIGRRNGGGEPLLLLGHFAAKDNRIYQVIVLGNEKAVSRDEAKTFLSSFKLN